MAELLFLRPLLHCYSADCTNWLRVTTIGKTRTAPQVRNVLLKDITVSGDPLPWKIILQGVDPQHMVENVIFDNVSCFGKLVTADSVGVNIGAHTRNVVFKVTATRRTVHRPGT